MTAAQQKAKGTWGHSFFFYLPLVAWFPKGTGLMWPHACLWPQRYLIRGKNSNRSFSELWRKRRCDSQEVPKGGDATAWAHAIKHQGRSVCSCPHRGRSFTPSCNQPWDVSHLSLSSRGCGGVVYKITKSKELHLMDLARLCMAIWDFKAGQDWHGIACYT